MFSRLIGSYSKKSYIKNTRNQPKRYNLLNHFAVFIIFFINDGMMGREEAMKMGPFYTFLSCARYNSLNSDRDLCSKAGTEKVVNCEVENYFNLMNLKTCDYLH